MCFVLLPPNLKVCKCSALLSCRKQCRLLPVLTSGARHPGDPLASQHPVNAADDPHKLLAAMWFLVFQGEVCLREVLALSCLQRQWPLCCPGVYADHGGRDAV